MAVSDRPARSERGPHVDPRSCGDRGTPPRTVVRDDGVVSLKEATRTQEFSTSELGPDAGLIDVEHLLRRRATQCPPSLERSVSGPEMGTTQPTEAAPSYGPRRPPLRTEGGDMSKHHPTPNDQRSVTKTPGSPAYNADRANRQALGHPDAPPPASPGDRGATAEPSTKKA